MTIMLTYHYFSSRCTSGNCQNGCGIREQKDVFKYEGCFKNGKAHGNGMFTAITGGKYIGEWFHGTKHGFGEYQYSNGTQYQGQWHQNQKKGMGVLKDKNGTVIFQGMWLFNKPVN